METKATSLHSCEWVELQRRLARLADLSGGGFSPEAMSPARIIRAFQDSVHDLQVDFPIKLVIYKLFDRVVVGRMRSEEHTSELQSLMRISYAVFCLKKKLQHQQSLYTHKYNNTKQTNKHI